MDPRPFAEIVWYLLHSRKYLQPKKSGDNKKFKDLKRSTQKEIRRAYWKYIDGIVSSETESELDRKKGQHYEAVLDLH
jgi:hypothetical protein